MTHVDAEWKQLKEVMVETAEQTLRCQPQPDNKGWFDEECKTAIDGKNVPYKNQTDRPTIDEKNVPYKNQIDRPTISKRL